jgi:hypothetical protein
MNQKMKGNLEKWLHLVSSHLGKYGEGDDSQDPLVPHTAVHLTLKHHPS